MHPTAPCTITISVTVTPQLHPSAGAVPRDAGGATSLPCVCAKCWRRLNRHRYNLTAITATITVITITSSVLTPLQPLFGPSAAPAIAVLHFIGTPSPYPPFPLPPLIPPPQVNHPPSPTPALHATTPDAEFPPPSLPHALSRYLSSLQQPQHSLRLRALFRSTFLYHASKAKCLAVPDAVVLLQYAARVVDCSGSVA